MSRPPRDRHDRFSQFRLPRAGFALGRRNPGRDRFELADQGKAARDQWIAVAFLHRVFGQVPRERVDRALNLVDRAAVVVNDEPEGTDTCSHPVQGIDERRRVGIAGGHRAFRRQCPGVNLDADILSGCGDIDKACIPA